MKILKCTIPHSLDAGRDAAFLLVVAAASGQTASEPKPQMAEEVSRRPDLEGISVNEFMGTMGFFCRLPQPETARLPHLESSADWGGMRTNVLKRNHAQDDRDGETPINKALGDGEP